MTGPMLHMPGDGMTIEVLPNVVNALAKVMAELPSIGKDGRAAQQQGGYAYRGIEAITRHAAPLLAKHGVVFVPQVTNIDVREITVNNKPWTDTYLDVTYRICGPGGPDDYVEATVVGIGRDNTDKGANKALTQAFKYALTQVLCIADAKDDADGTTVEADAAPVYDPLEGWADDPADARALAKDAHEALAERIKELSGDDRQRVRQACGTWPMNAADFVAVVRLLDEIAGSGSSPPGDGTAAQEAAASEDGESQPDPALDGTEPF